MVSAGGVEIACNCELKPRSYNRMDVSIGRRDLRSRSEGLAGIEDEELPGDEGRTDEEGDGFGDVAPSRLRVNGLERRIDLRVLYPSVICRREASRRTCVQQKRGGWFRYIPLSG